MPTRAWLASPIIVCAIPEMPRSIFKILWDGLEERRDMFAYMQNLTTTGGPLLDLCPYQPIAG